MKKKRILLASTCDKVRGFNELIEKIHKNISIQGQSESTFKNYVVQLVIMVLHFECLPTKLDEDKINDYLYLLETKHAIPSDSYFKTYGVWPSSNL